MYFLRYNVVTLFYWLLYLIGNCDLCQEISFSVSVNLTYLSIVVIFDIFDILCTYLYHTNNRGIQISHKIGRQRCEDYDSCFIEDISLSAYKAWTRANTETPSRIRGCRLLKREKKIFQACKLNQLSVIRWNMCRVIAISLNKSQLNSKIWGATNAGRRNYPFLVYLLSGSKNKVRHCVQCIMTAYLGWNFIWFLSVQC